MPISSLLSAKYLFLAFLAFIVTVSGPGLAPNPGSIGPEGAFPPASNCPAEKDTYDIEQDFGANGQDNKDDYYALLLASICLSGTDGKTLVFPDGTFRIRQYRITETTSDGRPANNVQLITYRDAARLRILGQGSRKTKIVINGDFHLSADEFSGFDGTSEIYKSYARSVTAFALVGCEECLLSGFEITGENEKMTRDPGIFSSGFSHCVMLSGVSDTTISDLFVHNCLADGVYITASGGQASERVTILNSRFLDSGRNNVSVIQARKVTFANNRFNRGLYFPPWGAVDVEPNIHDPSKVDQLTGNILFYNNQMSSRGIELNITRDVSGKVYLRRFALHFVSGFPPVYRNEINLSALSSVAECRVIPYSVYEEKFEDYFKEVFFGGRSLDIDDDGRQDMNPCGVSFSLLKNTVEFFLPPGSNPPEMAELRLNDDVFANTVSIQKGRLSVDTRKLPNGHWKMTFLVKDARGEAIPTALVPVIIANQRPEFGFAAATPPPGSNGPLRACVLNGRSGSYGPSKGQQTGCGRQP